MHDFKNDKRFKGLKPLIERALLSSPTMHNGAEMKYVQEAYDTEWVTTVGANIDELERQVSKYMGKRSVALASGTAAIHLAIKLAAEKVYQSSTGISTPNGKGYGGSMLGKRVFCSDLTFDATVNPIVYEGGEPIFIDSEYDTWNMDPEALKQAFKLYPDVKIVVLVHLYGTPAKIQEIRKICSEHKALLIEDAAESLGATVDGQPTGSFGDYGIISFNGNKIITGSMGGMLITPDEYSYNKAKKWSTQAREEALWYEHEELGYNYRMSNIVAGLIRGQWDFLETHIKSKRKIYKMYEEGLRDLPVSMNPMGIVGISNYWLSCGLIEANSMEPMVRNGRSAVYEIVDGKSCPTEILEALNIYNCEGRPIWKPMHEQPIYSGNSFVKKDGNGRAGSNAYIKMGGSVAVSSDLFNRGFCLPSDNKMKFEQQKVVIDIIHRCFR
ncbi:DegT/DnrJ/EryC1/StrS family aminotransferase [Schaedlerella arabinosiphila]|nr:DegT/DnrJ/EryC1/StrS family aminotransferase [Schaedlerella arabinosiphila]